MAKVSFGAKKPSLKDAPPADETPTTDAPKAAKGGSFPKATKAAPAPAVPKATPKAKAAAKGLKGLTKGSKSKGAERPTIDETAADEKADELSEADKLKAKIEALEAQLESQAPTPEPVEVEVVEEQEDKPAPTKRAASTALARRPAAGGDITRYEDADDGADQIDFSDIIVPKIHIAQKVGDLGEIFEPGSLVFNKSLEIPQPATLILVALQPKVYIERVSGGGMGQIASSPQEVVELGGTLDYKEAEKTKKPWFQDSITAVCLLVQPDDVDDPDLFNIEYGDDRFALALIPMKGASFTEGAKTIMTARRVGTPFSLRAGYNSQILSLTTWLKTHNTGNKSFVPKFEAVAATPEDLRQFAHELIHG